MTNNGNGTGVMNLQAETEGPNLCTQTIVLQRLNYLIG